MTNYVQWETAEEMRAERIAQEERRDELTRHGDVCPGISAEQAGADEAPTVYRQDETARRAQALFDLHCGIEPQPPQHL